MCIFSSPYLPDPRWLLGVRMKPRGFGSSHKAARRFLRSGAQSGRTNVCRSPRCLDERREVLQGLVNRSYERPCVSLENATPSPSLGGGTAVPGPFAVPRSTALGPFHDMGRGRSSSVGSQCWVGVRRPLELGLHAWRRVSMSGCRGCLSRGDALVGLRPWSALPPLKRGWVAAVRRVLQSQVRVLMPFFLLCCWALSFERTKAFCRRLLCRRACEPCSRCCRIQMASARQFGGVIPIQQICCQARDGPRTRRLLRLLDQARPYQSRMPNLRASATCPQAAHNSHGCVGTK